MAFEVKPLGHSKADAKEHLHNEIDMNKGMNISKILEKPHILTIFMTTRPDVKW